MPRIPFEIPEDTETREKLQALQDSILQPVSPEMPELSVEKACQQGLPHDPDAWRQEWLGIEERLGDGKAAPTKEGALFLESLKPKKNNILIEDFDLRTLLWIIRMHTAQIPPNLKKVSKAMGVNRETMTHCLDRLEKAAWICRRGDKGRNNQRIAVLGLALSASYSGDEHGRRLAKLMTRLQISFSEWGKD